jgi:hypothetical protein
MSKYDILDDIQCEFSPHAIFAYWSLKSGEIRSIENVVAHNAKLDYPGNTQFQVNYSPSVVGGLIATIEALLDELEARK